MREIGETFFAPDRETWRAWLEKHHEREREIWLVLLKKHVSRPSVTLAEAVEEALCFGWIDGHLRRIDDESHALRFTPRGRRSVWAQSNKDRVERLIREGKMTPAGLTAVEAAKASGEWDAATARENVNAVPEDLGQALREVGAYTAFTSMAPSHRKQYLYWVNEAKRDETRRRRIAETVRRVREGRRPG
jgi:uncharacterized protein YdeI (YjbR/CyaY-like superfamily)